MVASGKFQNLSETHKRPTKPYQAKIRRKSLMRAHGEASAEREASSSAGAELYKKSCAKQVKNLALPVLNAVELKKKEILRPLALVLCVINLVLSFQTLVVAQSQPSASSIIESIGEKTKLPSYQTAGHAGASYQEGASNITSAILFAIDFLKYIMGSIAIFFIIYSGIRLLTGARQIEDIASKQKEHLKYAIIGLIVIMVADQFVKKAFFGEQGEIYASKTTLQEAAKSGTELIRGVYNVFEYFAASVAVLMIVISGFRYATSGGNEEIQNKAKKNITYAVIGLMLIGIAEFAVKDVIFPSQGAKLSNIENAKKLIVNMTNFISGFVATLSAIMYIYGGYLYVTAFGKEDNTGKAKKVFIGATIGLLLALGAFALVSTTVNLQSELPKPEVKLAP